MDTELVFHDLADELIADGNDRCFHGFMPVFRCSGRFPPTSRRALRSVPDAVSAGVFE